MRICFYSGYRDLKGGYSTLLITLIAELYRQGQEVILFNFQDGLLARELEKANVNIRIIDIEESSSSEIAASVSAEDVIVLTRFEEFYLHFMEVNPKVVYYDINDFIEQISDYKFNIKLRSAGKKLIRKLLDQCALFFMDDTGIFNIGSGFGIHPHDPVFLPVPVKTFSENQFLETAHQQTGILNITYIGRAVDWKMMPLKKILTDLLTCNCTEKIVFSIVTDSSSEMKKFIHTDLYNDTGMSLVLYENLAPSEINTFLLEHAHLHFAMGTAALDAAKLGIPTIVMDYDNKEFPNNYRYKWLYEVKEFSLGKNLSRRESGGGFTMQQILDFVLKENSGSFFSKRSFDYVSKNHSAEVIACKLTTLCSASDFRLRDARPYIPFYFKTHRLLKKLAGVFSGKP